MILLAGLRLALGLPPGFHEPFGEVAARLHKKGPGAAGHVTNLEAEKFPGRADRPLPPEQALGGPELDERLRGMLDNGFGQAPGRVVRPATAAVGPRRDEDAARGDD